MMPRPRFICSICHSKLLHGTSQPPLPAADHLHVVAGDLADLARLGDGLELAQRLVEQVVLHHPQDPVVRLRRVQHPLRLAQVIAHRLLHVDVPAVAEQLGHAVGVQRDRQQDLDRVDLEAAGRQLGGGRERARARPVRLALRAAFLARIDERDDLDVGVAGIRADVQVVDPAQADERGPHRAVVGHERHRNRPPPAVRSSVTAGPGPDQPIAVLPLTTGGPRRGPRRRRARRSAARLPSGPPRPRRCARRRSAPAPRARR